MRPVLRPLRSSRGKTENSQALFSDGNHGITKDASDTGDLGHDQHPVGSHPGHQLLAKEEDTDLGDHTDGTSMTDELVILLEDLAKEVGLEVGHDGTDVTGDEDEGGEEQEVGILEESEGGGTDGGAITLCSSSFLGGRQVGLLLLAMTTTVSMVSALFQVKVEVGGDAEVDGEDEEDRADARE